ncbi:MAG: ribbon-helix-helix protein, CopG family, partial [Clostridia bacterium]|nr:ribbon-helix-helix protein, CopG family [Clostridia bacterium]
MAVKKIKKNTAAFYLTDEVTEALEEKAKKTGISKSEIVEQYLTQAIIDKDQEKKPMIITIMSFKGGVAKTTSAASLAICL